ncbi:MAG: phosphoribosylaminoimidazolesuccinocarboxamide synthase [Chloroflexia bacterium]
MQDLLHRPLGDALSEVDLPWPYGRSSGKVRESFLLPDGRRLLVATDRLSAFDRILAAVPGKGQVLNELSAFWFESTADLIPHHLLDVPDPNVSLVRECRPLPVEVVVRGYITGVTRTSLWTLYAAGERHIYGYTLPEGLHKDDPLPEPLLTPTTKAGPGKHDERLSCAEVVERGLVEPSTWEAVSEAALALFRRGQEIARRAGFILVDTKYEFGLTPEGELRLIDEVHTPDSSRFWRQEEWEAARRVGGEAEPWDKEYVRLWYARRGYRGDGPPPALPAEVLVELAGRYIALYEGLTGRTFVPAPLPAGPRIARVLQTYLERE